jgi:hypothetical protein
MKVQNSQGKTIPLAQVAELTTIPGKEVSKDGPIAIFSGDIMDSDGTLEAGVEAAIVTIPATDENLAKAEVALEKMEESRRGFDVKPGQRPSLEVETEVHVNLLPRIEAHLARMRAWDLRKLSQETRQKLIAAMDTLANSTSEISTLLDYMRTTGFVAKTTPVTRLASKLFVGARVSLRDDQREIFAKVYSEEQLDSLSVVKVTDTHVQLMAEDGSNLGLVRIIHVTVKP